MAGGSIGGLILLILILVAVWKIRVYQRKLRLGVMSKMTIIEIMIMVVIMLMVLITMMIVMLMIVVKIMIMMVTILMIMVVCYWCNNYCMMVVIITMMMVVITAHCVHYSEQKDCSAG